MNPFKPLRKEKEPDELALRQRRERGERAKRLMNDELLVEAFEAVEAYYMGAWRGSAALDVEMRERAHISVNLLDDLKRHLTRVAIEGVAAANALQLAEEKKRRRNVA